MDESTGMAIDDMLDGLQLDPELYAVPEDAGGYEFVPSDRRRITPKGDKTDKGRG